MGDQSGYAGFPVFHYKTGLYRTGKFSSKTSGDVLLCCLTLVSPCDSCPLGSSESELPSRHIPVARPEIEPPSLADVESGSEAGGVSRTIGWSPWCIKALKWRGGR